MPNISLIFVDTIIFIPFTIVVFFLRVILGHK